jgi:hypothetical protein
MQALADEDEDLPSAGSSSKNEDVQQPAWMRTLSQQCQAWLGALPEVSWPYLPANRTQYMRRTWRCRNSERGKAILWCDSS